MNEIKLTVSRRFYFTFVTRWPRASQWSRHSYSGWSSGPHISNVACIENIMLQFCLALYFIGKISSAPFCPILPLKPCNPAGPRTPEGPSTPQFKKCPCISGKSSIYIAPHILYDDISIVIKNLILPVVQLGLEALEALEDLDFQHARGNYGKLLQRFLMKLSFRGQVLLKLF